MEITIEGKKIKVAGQPKKMRIWPDVSALEAGQHVTVKKYEIATDGLARFIGEEDVTITPETLFFWQVSMSGLCK